MLQRPVALLSALFLIFSCVTDQDERYANTFVREASSSTSSNDAILPFDAT